MTHHIRTRTRRIIADLDRARAQLDHLADDGPAILRRAEEARLDPRLQPVGAGWGPPDPVGHAVSTGLSDQLIRNANDMIAQQQEPGTSINLSTHEPMALCCQFYTSMATKSKYPSQTYKPN